MRIGGQDNIHKAFLQVDRRSGKILKAVNIKDGKIAEFVYPEKVVVKEEESKKENRISWLHNK